MKIHPIFVILVFFFISCSSTYYVKNEDSSYNEMNEKIEGKKVTVVLNNGEEISGSNVFVKSVLTSVDEISIPTANINKITKTNHLLGAVGGAIIGATAGAGLGLIYDYARNISYPYIEYNIWDEEFKSEGSLSTKSDGEGAVIGGLIGIGSGVLIGVLNGPTDSFIFSPTETEDKTQIANPEN